MRVIVIGILVFGGPLVAAIWFLGGDYLGIAGIVAFFAIIGLVNYLLIRLHEAHWRKGALRVWKQDIREFEATHNERIAAKSLTCQQCDSVAIPVLNSRNRYRCDHCNREFTDRDHCLVDLEEFKRSHPHPSDRPYPLTP
jgi:hypothetical protein